MSYSIRQRVLKSFENEPVEDIKILKVWTTDDAIHVLGTYKDMGGFEDKRFAMTLERQTGPLDEYDAEADAYDELYSDEQRSKYQLAFPRMVFSGEDLILDCGCGTGIFLEKVEGSVQFAVGVDLSLKMLERAKLRLGQISNVDLVCADIDFLPFSEGTFRHVFMFTVLPGVHTYWGDTISEALRAPRTDGIMTLSVPKKETSSEKLLRKLSMNKLEPRELVDDDKTPDYIVINKETRRTIRKAEPDFRF